MNKNYLFITASFVFLLFVGQVSSQDHLWTFDEGTGTISYDKGTSRNSVNAVLNNAQWRDLSKVGPGAAVHITGADNSYVFFGNNNRRSLRGGDDDNKGFGDNSNVGNNSPNGDDNDNQNSFPNNGDGNGRRNFPNNDNNNGEGNFPNSDNGNGRRNFPNNDNNNDQGNFPNSDDNNGRNDFRHHHDNDGGDNSPNNNDDNNDGDNFSNNDNSDSDNEDNFPNNNNRNNVGQFGTQDFTVAFWFQTTDTSVALADLIGNRAASGHGNFFAVRLTSDGYVSAEVDQDAAGTNYIGIRSRQNGLNDGNWHQVVVTRSGRTLTLYIDGSVSNYGTGTGVANINNGVVFKIGRSLVDPNTYRFALDSVFDDVSIYSNAISAYQVNALYQGATNQ